MAKSFILWIAVLALLVAIWVGKENLFHQLGRRLAPAEISESAEKPLAPVADDGIPVGELITYHPLADAVGAPASAPQKEPAMLYELLLAYRRLAGEFPTAEDNPGLMRKLRGQNPTGTRVFPEAHPRYAGDGSLLDAWGTPFFFHHVSSQRLEIRSAGPDQTFYTDDDLIAPPPPSGETPF